MSEQTMPGSVRDYKTELFWKQLKELKTIRLIEMACHLASQREINHYTMNLELARQADEQWQDIMKELHYRIGNDA